MDDHLTRQRGAGSPSRAGLRTQRTLAAWPICAACVALAASGCASVGGIAGGSGQEGERVAPWGASTTLFITAEDLGEGTYFLLRPPPPENGGSPDALVSGELAVLDGGCLGLSPVTAVAWPDGTTALPDGDGVELSDGQVLRIGDEVESGGGYAGVTFTGRAADCPGSDVAFINDPRR